MRARTPVHHFGARDHRAQRQSARDALRGSENIGRDVEMLGRPHLAGASHAALHFVEDQQDAVTIGQTPQLLVEGFRWNQITALALDRLHNDARHFVGRKDGSEQLVLDEANAAYRVIIRADTFGTAIRIGKMRVVHAWNQRSEALALHHLAARERKRTHGSAVKRSGKSDELVAARMVTSQLHRGSRRFGPRVPEILPMGPVAGAMDASFSANCTMFS